MWEWIRQLWIPTSATKLAESERRVLSFVRFPYQQSQVPIGDGLMINTIYSHNSNPKNKHIRSPLVLLHGFGAAVGFWLLNLDAFAERYEHVYAIDLLGCGRSSRPAFRAKTPQEAEYFFIEALEKWRIHQKIDKMILLGHSFGAYVGASYSMAHTSRVSHLILASPVGVPEEPRMVDETPRQRSSIGWRMIRSMFRFLWNQGYTPLSFVRVLGPLGPKPVKHYVMRRFFMGPAVEDIPPTMSEAGLEASAAIADRIETERLKLPKEDMANYLYHLCANTGSGEFALPRILNPRVFAYLPLEKRLGDSEIARATFLYGDQDWMDVKGGTRTVKSMNNRPDYPNSARLVIVPKAGHQLTIDNPDQFHEAVFQAIENHSDSSD